jgi:hypothetical protein
MAGEYVYPGSDLDQSKILLSLLGTFWSRTYTGSDQLQSYAIGTAELVAQNHRNVLETAAALSRYEIPLFHEEHLFPISIRKSELNNAAINATLFDDNENNFDGELSFDGTDQTELFGFPAPDSLVRVEKIFNKIAYPTVALSSDIDFTVDQRRGSLVFVSNPFDNPGFLKRVITVDGVDDEEIVLWAFSGKFDYEFVFKQFAYALGIHLRSSENYKALMNAVFDSLVRGGLTAKNLDLAISAVCGIPVVIEPQERVEVVEYDAAGLLIVTDKNVYKFNGKVTPVVSPEEIVLGGTQLVRGFEVNEFFVGNSYAANDSGVIRPDVTKYLSTNSYDKIATEVLEDEIILNRGYVDSGSNSSNSANEFYCAPRRKELAALALDNSFLSTCFYSDLVFENKEFPLFVDTEHESGYTYVHFPLDGYPADVRRFFDDVHDRGVALAQLDKIPCFTDALEYPTLSDFPTRGRLGPVYYAADTQKYYEWSLAETYVEIIRLPVVKKLGTLAHMLDRRKNPSSEPTAANLPEKINPMRFLIENVLRNNVFVVRIDVSALGRNRLGLYNIRHLRQVLPPHTAMIVLFELSAKADRVKAEDHVFEANTNFTGIEPQLDTIDDTLVLDQGATLTRLSGTCQ